MRKVRKIVKGFEGTLVDSEVLGVDTHVNLLVKFNSKIVNFNSIQTQLFDVFMVSVVFDPTPDPVSLGW